MTVINFLISERIQNEKLGKEKMNSTYLSTSIPFRPFATISYKNFFSFIFYIQENH